MDVSNTSRDDRMIKLLCSGKSKCEEEGEDRISCLPENIIHHILSFLPTHDAVGTSLLAKSWKSLWRGVSRLDFNQIIIHSNETYKNMDFVNFVEKVLLLHDSTKVLNKFGLTCTTDMDTSRVSECIYTALIRKIQKLNVSISAYSPIVFPSNLFTCDSLTVLKITALYSSINLPASVCLPSLKLLHLTFLSIFCEQGTHLVCFNFPVLEEFMFLCCVYENIKAVEMFTPTLGKLLIKEPNDGLYTDCKINIYAESLKSLEVTTSLTYDLCLCNLSSLCDALLDFEGWYNPGHSHRVTKLLEGICNVKHLTFGCPLLTKFSSTKDFCLLSKLTSLTVTRSDFLGPLSLTELLHFLPNIESLLFIDGIDKFSTEGYNWAMEVTPQSFPSHLKSFEIRRFAGNENELSLVEKMTIISSFSLSADSKKKTEITEQLSVLPRCSLGSVIDFS